VYTSSPSVIFDGRDQQGLDESTPYARRWLCGYPRSKALAEQVVLSAHRDAGMRTCALRPHLIWGPGDRHLVPRLLQRAAARRLVQVGRGANLIDMVYIDNVVDAHMLAAEALEGRAAGGQAYFITQGEPVGCWQWINDLLALAGLPAVSRRIPFRVAWYAGRCLESTYRRFHIGADPPMTRFLAAQLARSHYYTIERARRDLGYEPRVSTREGMSRLAGDLASMACATTGTH